MKIAEEDFDPTRVLDGWQPPRDAAPREIDLGVIFGATRRATLDVGQLERLRRRGVATEDIEDIGFEESRPSSPFAQSGARSAEALEPGPADFVDTVSAADEVEEHEEAEDIEARLIEAAPAPSSEARVLGHWKPGCWIAALRCLQPQGLRVSSTSAGPSVQNVEAQWLVAVWPPQRLDAPLLSRWPQALRVVSALDEASAVAAMVSAVPGRAPLWRAELEVDWSLLAALAAVSDEELSPWLRRALASLAEQDRAERERRLVSDYTCVDGLVTRR